MAENEKYQERNGILVPVGTPAPGIDTRGLKSLDDILRRQKIETIPENFQLVFESLDEYRISHALSEIDDLEIGNLFREGSLPRNTPIFRGTDRERYNAQFKELWWTFNLRKAGNYARKNQNPLILVGKLNDLSGFQDVQYIEDSIYIASLESYRGNFSVIPHFITVKTGFLSLPRLNGFERGQK